MTQEQKDITLHSAPFEMMNRCINFEDGTIDREMMLKAMHTYADMYHRNELSKLHQPTVISSVCQHSHSEFGKCSWCGEQIFSKPYDNKQTDL